MRFRLQRAGLQNVEVILGDRRAELWEAKVIAVIPDIAVEILSPSETTPSIHRKLKQYFQAGVKEVWLIDCESREAEVWTGPSLPERTLAESDALESQLLKGFVLPLTTCSHNMASPSPELPASPSVDLSLLAFCPSIEPPVEFQNDLGYRCRSGKYKLNILKTIRPPVPKGKPKGGRRRIK